LGEFLPLGQQITFGQFFKNIEVAQILGATIINGEGHVLNFTGPHFG
jgi:hypothetical protein